MSPAPTPQPRVIHQSLGPGYAVTLTAHDSGAPRLELAAAGTLGPAEVALLRDRLSAWLSEHTKPDRLQQVVDRICFQIANTFDDDKLWQSMRNDPHAYREAVKLAIGKPCPPGFFCIHEVLCPGACR